MAASCQSMERDSALRRSSVPHPRILEQALVRVVGGYSGRLLPALDLVQSTDIPAPESFDHWTSKALLGERVWLNRDSVPIPVYHRTEPNILSALSGIGMLFVFCGVLMFDVWPAVFGMIIVYSGKV